MTNFNINDAGGFKNFIQHIEKNKNLSYFEEKEEGVLVPISFPEFEELSHIEKQKVYEKLESVIEKIVAPPYNERSGFSDASTSMLEKFPTPTNKTLSKIILTKNAIFYSLHKSTEETSIPKEIMGHLQAYTTPKDIQSASSVSKAWEMGGPDARMLHINQGVAMRNAIPPQIKTATDAVEWLKKNVNCKALTYVDFRGFKDLDEKKLKELIVICPNISDLFIESVEITKIDVLPDNLQRFECHGCDNLKELLRLPSSLLVLKCVSCSNLNKFPTLPEALQELGCTLCSIKQLPTLPDTLQVLDCHYCFMLKQLPALPATLQKLYCSHCDYLNELPILPDTLQMLYCYFCSNLNELPTLPASLQTLYCVCNNLNELPTLPLSLQTLDCSSNNLNQLPTLPPSLQKLECGGCPLDQESEGRAKAFKEKNINL